jgi:hypothetical protein
MNRRLAAIFIAVLSVTILACGEDEPDPQCVALEACCSAVQADPNWSSQAAVSDHCPPIGATDGDICHDKFVRAKTDLVAASAARQVSLPAACN